MYKWRNYFSPDRERLLDLLLSLLTERDRDLPLDSERLCGDGDLDRLLLGERDLDRFGDRERDLLLSDCDLDLLAGGEPDRERDLERSLDFFSELERERSTDFLREFDRERDLPLSFFWGDLLRERELRLRDLDLLADLLRDLLL